MAQTHSKRQKDIKSKLMAAVSMLLVSSIMMVSSTYAWFTLSTAPEVTGINTSVGANGNLEMALQPLDGVVTGITSGEGDSTKAAPLRNITWGNLVDLSDASYGMNGIKLYPAALNINGTTQKLDLETGFLQTPAYGADGRVSNLLKNTSTSTYEVDSFPGNSNFGVRAVGVASGMTPRQMAYRDASSAGNTAMNLARNNAAASLKANGKVLADVAIKHALADDPDPNTYSAAQVDSMKAIVNTLKTGVLDEIEKAYVKYIIAYTASKSAQDGGLSDTDFDGFYANAKDLTTISAVKALGNVRLPSEIQTYIDKLDATKAIVSEASVDLEDLDTSDASATFTWGQISTPMSKLVKVNALQLNGTAVTALMSNFDALVTSVMSDGLNVIMASGGGVYADVADHTGDFDVSIKLDAFEYSGLKVPAMDARMKTDGAKPTYLSVIAGAVKAAQAPASSGGTTMPLSEFYGYVVDLAFRTNAPDSDLLLQVEPADRIYDDNAADAETRGHGSTMTFKSASSDFSDESVKDLMENIRVVFFNTTDGTILANAKLDMSEGKVTSSADGITAPIRLYTTAGATSEEVSYVESENGTYGKISAGQEYYEAVDAGNGDWNLEGNNWVEATGTGAYNKVQAEEEMYVLLTHISGAYASEKYEKVTNSSTASSDTFVADNEAEIMPLTQNTATAVSVLVYLDGTSIQNSDVAALGSTSMTGTMNLQFASSANLVPMEYASLHTPGSNQQPATP